MWGSLEARASDPPKLLEVLEVIAFENIKKGSTMCTYCLGAIDRFHFLVIFTGNRREFSILDIDECGLLSRWPPLGDIPFIKTLEDTRVQPDSKHGLYQFAHLSFQGLIRLELVSCIGCPSVLLPFIFLVDNIHLLSNFSSLLRTTFPRTPCSCF